MKQDFYLIKNGILNRKENTVYFYSEKDRHILPINTISSIYCYGRVTFTSGVVSYLSKKGIPMHFFNYYGYYEGTYYPKESLLSGETIVRQAEHYLDKEKRMILAKEILRGGISNIKKNLSYYKLVEEVESIKIWGEKIEDVNSISELMSIEGNIRNIYYKSFDKILPDKYIFDKRSRRPPKNMLNALISFSNSLIYATILTEIYNTQLNPTISYLHEPFKRRFSLSLDLSEIFKPFIGDRVIFKLLNKKIISENEFDKDLNYCLLNDPGKRILLKYYNERLDKTIKHRTLGRKVSYKHIIRLECYKLIKHVSGIKDYEAFRIWW